MKTSQEQRKQRRQFLHWMLIAVAVLFASLILRFAFIMLGGHVNGVDLEQSAQAMYQRSSILTAKRGTIYDIGGNPLALDATSYSLYAVLTEAWQDAEHVTAETRDHTAEVLSQHLDMDKEEILKILSTKNVNQVEFGNAGSDLSYAQMDAIRQEKLPGIEFRETPSRSYPNGVFASHLVGYAQFKQAENAMDDRLVGQLGLEKNKDQELQGKNGYVSFSKAEQNDQEEEAADDQIAPVDGQNLYTTLDSRLQTYLETLVTQVNDTYKPENLTAMLVDPKTGKIAAATQRPTFNPQTREGLDTMWKNLLVEESFEPGSTMKVLTLAAAIEEGVFDPNASYMSGAISVDGGVIRDYNHVGWGMISQLDGVARSSNVLFVQLVGDMGYDVWKEYMYEFGLMQKPNSVFKEEVAGSMSYDYEIEKVSTGFGQGLRVTPWQMVQAFTAIANGGEMMRLQIIDRMENSQGDLQVVQPEKIAAPISNETAQKTLQYLRRVVEDPQGTGQMYAVEGTEIAAKTGTAEIYDTDKQTYLSGGFNYLYSVVGFAPADNPQYILYLTIKKPKMAGDGKQPAVMLADIFVPLLTRALDYAKLAETGGYDQTEMVDVTGKNPGAAQQELERQGFLKVEVLGTGKQVIDQSPKPGSNYSMAKKVYLLTDEGVRLPDFSGLTRNESEALAKLLNIPVRIEGEGLVVGQSVDVNTPIESVDQVLLQLQQP
ncbi:penicillin-binding protein [Aerococcus sp. UMB10185]|uniref:penicillin-binding protein n=1 Tax=unclassified Aerococcus TaxID=2618060 RepID=UPI0008A4455A|nr:MULTISPECIES: penicillin-binding protein [unclassified Aerococcus]KAB0647746.1 penicillin-binding protein [Aerococcus sanguinicola]MDK6233012.1 penicillin-binding protein [Aerococcus sp. UMB10185]MDK6855306.1 penicillin-binding protein [Aerococcus sp. UMB7533]MDK8502162.1 penicillin-binding protein [Aerococcus sp. UMB1112A]OFN04870.1 penicillin-binding protein [Aerococcus sp. HMSC062A02]